MKPRDIQFPASNDATQGKIHLRDYLQRIGVKQLPPSTSPFDPGYDPLTLEGHLEQSAHLMSILKISMACWMIADESATRRKTAAARRHGVPTVTGGGPFEVAVAQGQLPAYLDLCADIGAQVEIRRQLSLRYRDFKRTTTGHGGHSVAPGRCRLSPCGRFVGDHPAGHGNLEDRHQVSALLQMAFQGQRVVTRIEWAG